ncbi:signal transduction histidine kinase [Actinoplanes octamycinicus]|uniref:histidine kinase n=1 Tax=Actinoplanes octamycinicus TaxID=135948 RepID=A0A7W7M8V8_9ACTN|nr:histidine kinase [Actinoplanes octamycinicus]MBB4741225.1 signal transduction histidine kinase [Actinoplanes octamycinicus]GIE56132.1 hypothetical protein Aoc01nite_15340 [Actinoplanes octamycinicus]
MRVLAIDAGVAGLIALVAGATALTSENSSRPMAPWGWALIAAAVVALLWRRRFPVVTLAVASAAALLYYPLGFPDSAMALTFIVALYTVGRRRGLRWSVPAAVVIVAAFGLLGAGRRDAVAAAAGVSVIVSLAVLTGEVARGRDRAVTEARERAAVDERLRIARDLHDSLGHQLSLISVQAGAALHTRSAEQSFEALEAVRAASKEALAELRTVLGVLRGDGHTLAGLPELVRRTESAGLPVRIRVDVGPAALPAAVETTAYRIVQEALTNAVRHATATSAEVAISRTGDEVVVLVENDGGPAAEAAGRPGGSGLRGNSGDSSEGSGGSGNADSSSGSSGSSNSDSSGNIGSGRSGGSGGSGSGSGSGEGGNSDTGRGGSNGTGLRGMAERAAAAGGTVDAGPRPDGGFRVRARLPIGGAR